MSHKYHDASWDFRTANTKKHTHCFHTYPAMMIPQVAGRIIDRYGAKAKVLFDPYCGTGSSLVEANLRGIKAIGTDLNPLARLIAEAKTTTLELQIVDLYLKEYVNFIFGARFGIQTMSVVIPNFTNRDFWFRKSEQENLAVIKIFIDSIECEDVARFFKVAFSETVREVSLTKNSEFKLVRMSERQREKFNPDVFGLMEAKLSRNRNGLKEYLEALKAAPQTKVYGFNTVKESPTNYIEVNSVDLVVSSPPYGDSQTTVAYGQFSRLANQWLGVEAAHALDKSLMGGKKIKSMRKFNFAPLDAAIESIAAQDEKRVFDVISFYDDYEKSINHVANIVKKKGIVGYVVGNRKVKGVQLPTDEVTVELFKRNDFQHKETIIRNIPNKRMPSRNSPSNVAGLSDNTMKHEYVVIMERL